MTAYDAGLAPDADAEDVAGAAWARLVPHMLQLRQRIDSLEAARSLPRDPDLGEQAIAAEGDDVDEGLERSLRLKLLEAEDALKRIEAGSYGTCNSCGEPIPAARLRALPTALRCVECETRQPGAA